MDGTRGLGLSLGSALALALATTVQLVRHLFSDEERDRVAQPRLCAILVNTPHAPTSVDGLGSIADNATGLLVGAGVNQDVAVETEFVVFLLSHGACSFVLVLIAGDVNRSHTYNVTC